MSPDGIRDAFRIVEQGEDVRVWQDPAQGFNDLFPSPHAEKPIMNNGALHSTQSSPSILARDDGWDRRNQNSQVQRESPLSDKDEVESPAPAITELASASHLP